MRRLFLFTLLTLLAASPVRAEDKDVAELYGVRTGSTARVVFVIDHSGSMIDTYDFLREELKKQVAKLNANQQFAVIMYSEKVDEVFPKDGAQLVAASPENKRMLNNFVDNVRAAGKNDESLEPPAAALKQAIALKPQTIYFLCDTSFDPKLVNAVKDLNKDAKAIINTIAFIKVSKEAEEGLKKIADDNGGQFKYVKANDLGK
jgi:hypothetical protein